MIELELTESLLIRNAQQARLTLELARALGIAVVGEGAELEAQASLFRGADCAEPQGFLFCKPVPVDKLERYLAAAPHRPDSHRAALRDIGTEPPWPASAADTAKGPQASLG